MSFVSPYLLWGAAAAGIPIALHFFFRSRYRTVPWAAMKFLLTSIEQTSRRLRFQELLLLIVRVLLLVLLALALARPVMDWLGGGGRQPVDAVFAFDVSYSMGAKDGEMSRFERAQAAALQILDQLPPHSTVRIVSCADRAARLGPREPDDFDQARRIMGDLKLTHLATDLYPGVVEAHEILTHCKAATKEFYLFSDMQKLGWDQQSGGMVAALKEIKDLAAVHLVRCGTRPVKNAAIVGVTPQTGSPRPGERVGFSVLVRNGGNETVKDVEVSLAVDGNDKEREVASVAEIGPGQTRAVTVMAKFKEPGLRLVSAKITHDELPGDNGFDQVVQVRDRISALIVDGDPNERDPEKASSYRVAQAMDAMGCGLRIVPPNLASSALLKDQDLCVLVNVALQAKLGQEAVPPSQDFLKELVAFVRRGKSLIVFAGDNVAAEPYNRVLGDKYGLLPSRILGRMEVPYKSPLQLNRDTFVHPTYRHLKEDKRFLSFNKVEMYRALDMEEPAARASSPAEPPPLPGPAPEQDETFVIARYGRQVSDGVKDKEKPAAVVAFGDGKPAVLLRRAGSGQVLFVTTAPQRDLKNVTDVENGKKVNYQIPTWTNWLIPPGEEMFVVFLKVALAQLLHEESQGHNLVAGQSLTWYPRDKELQAYVLKHPDGEEERLGLPEEEKLAGGGDGKSKGRLMVTSGRLSKAGVYQLLTTAPPQPRALDPEPAEPKTTSIPLAVVPDLRESENLESLTDPEIDERLGFQPVHLTAGRDAATLERVSREWTPWLLLAVLLLAVVESLLAWWCGRAW